MARHWWPLVLFVLGALGTIAAVDFWLERQTEATLRIELTRTASQTLSRIEGRVMQGMGRITLLEDLQDVVAKPPPAQFGRFAGDVMSDAGLSFALIAEKVDGEQRERAEHDWRSVYPDFAIRNVNANGRLIMARLKTEYYPVIYLTGVTPPRLTVGLDLGNEPQIRGALTMARNGGRTVVTEPIRARHDSPVTVLALRFGANTTHRLFAVGLHPQTLVEAAAGSYNPTGLRYYWFDITDDSRVEALYPTSLDYATLPSLVVAERKLKIGNRVWRLDARLPPAELTAQASAQRGLVWSIGLLFTVFIASIIWRLTERQQAYSRQAGRLARQNEQLTTANATLQTAADAARDSELRLKTILDTANEAVVLIDERGRIELFNAAAERLFGYHAREALGQVVGMLMPSAYRERHREAMERYNRTGQSRVMGTSRELVGQRKDGVAFPIELSLNEFRLGDAHYFVGVIRDITDRKRAERILFDSEYKHRAILDAAYIGIYVYQDGKLRYVNPTFAGYFGTDATALVGAVSWSELVPTEWLYVLEEVLSSEGGAAARPRELQCARQDGSRFYALLTAKPIIFDNRPGLAGSLLDISERKAVEQAMLRAEIKNHAILEAIPDLMVQLDGNGVFVDYRAKVGGDDFGLPADCLGQHFKRVLDPDFALRLEDAMRQIRAWYRPVVFEFALALSSRQHYFEARISPCGEADFLLMLRDISERKAIEAELIRHRDHLQDLVDERTAELQATFDASPIATAFVVQRRFVRVNTACCKLFERSIDELVGASVRIIHPDDHSFEGAPQVVFPRLIEGGVYQAEHQFVTGSGELIWCSIFGKAIDPHDMNRGLVWVYQDIGEQKATADALKRAKELAEAANQAKSEFLANMSHELRTPMHAVLSFSELGEAKAGKVESEKLAHYFQRISASGKRLLQILNDLLDLSKLEAGKMRYDMRPQNLLPIVHEAVDELAAICRPRGVRIVVDTPHFEPMAVCDALRISQVVRNLVSNAIKFSPDNGEVRVGFDEVESEGTHWLAVWIADQGVGIPAEELEAIFDKFIQSSKTKTGAGGTGLGLAICREIVRAHNGAIRADNRETGGALFEFRLPRAGKTEETGI
ncbi:PAS domain S-box protein [Parachitinimonas caeni]|uniref:histidine kinase n=1 Tax=Parachitinimonas caeni TaxID=3031301 RepID=A0ABT7DXT7_9NEIS|nr:PAS domain S-box protein [Parachitinimonas caeni]MDK2124850.1 PAS domain S-box protein [Parachitinimonas caeni]